VPAWFWADGEQAIQVTIRRKSSRALPSEGNPIKVSWKVDINQIVDGQKWHGLTKLSLENGADTDPISEGFAWNLHELASVDGFYGAGYHAGLANWVRVNMNGAYIGVYVNVEQRDKQFLRNHGIYFGESRTWLYEIDDLGAGAFELEVGAPHSPLWNELSYSPFRVGSRKSPSTPIPSDAVLAAELPTKIEMQAMLTLAAVDAFSSNNDATFTHGKNFRFVDFVRSD
jgi:spore coat protein CotH